jgi:hypothetical protein
MRNLKLPILAFRYSPHSMTSEVIPQIDKFRSGINCDGLCPVKKFDKYLGCKSKYLLQLIRMIMNLEFLKLTLDKHSTGILKRVFKLAISH